MKSAPDMISNQDGFSLIEMLVAVFLLSIVSMISLSVMSNFADANQMVGDKMSQLGKIENAGDYLRADLREALDRNFYVKEQSIDGDLLFRVTRGSAENSRISAEYSPIETVEYRISKGKLIRRSYLRPEATEKTPFRDYILLEQVEDISLKFYDGFLWQDFWINKQSITNNTLPRALEISWKMKDGDGQRTIPLHLRFPVGRRL